MTYVSQIITLYALNLYGAVCQSYLNKTGRKNANLTWKKSYIKTKRIISRYKNLCAPSESDGLSGW